MWQQQKYPSTSANSYLVGNFKAELKVTKPTENFSNTFLKLIDKHAGKDPDFKVTFP
jgi:hypothetical protein